VEARRSRRGLANGPFELKASLRTSPRLPGRRGEIAGRRDREEGSEVKIVVQVQNSMLVVVEIKVESSEPSPSPSPGLVHRHGGASGRDRARGDVVAGNASSFTMNAAGPRHPSPSTRPPPPSAASGREDRDRRRVQGVLRQDAAGAKVHVRGTLMGCSGRPPTDRRRGQGPEELMRGARPGVGRGLALVVASPTPRHAARRRRAARTGPTSSAATPTPTPARRGSTGGPRRLVPVPREWSVVADLSGHYGSFAGPTSASWPSWRVRWRARAGRRLSRSPRAARRARTSTSVEVAGSSIGDADTDWGLASAGASTTASAGAGRAWPRSSPAAWAKGHGRGPAPLDRSRLPLRP